MSNSNPACRSPSRNQVHRPAAHHSSNSNPTPGVLAVSSAMMANANQSQNGGSKSTGKRSKAAASSQQRRSQSNTSPGAEDESVSRQQGGPVSALTATLESSQLQLPTAAAAQSPSPSKRRGKKQSNKSAVSTGGYNTSDVDEQLLIPGHEASHHQLAGQGSDSPAHNTRSSGGTRTRPKHRRGISSSNLTFTSSADADRAAADILQPKSQQQQPISHPRPEPIDTDLASAAPAALSKSAPASSFLESAYAARRKGGNGNSISKQSNNNNNNNNSNQQEKRQSHIRSSNSADEWEMPSAGLIKGNDELTWQQQAALTRKGSQGRKAGKSTSVTAFNPTKNNRVQSNANHSTIKQGDSASTPQPSGIAQSIAANANSNAQPSQASPTLTWQQALLQRSAPATPASSKVFDALEEGHSGARPASDHHRTRSSPAKPARPNTRLSQQQQQFNASNPGSEDDSGLEKNFNDLSLSKSKGAALGKSGGAKKSKPIPINPAGPSYQRSQIDQEKEDSPGLAQPSHVTASAPAAPAKQTAAATTSLGSVSPTKNTALYAGPKFHNSPHAGALPTPKLAAFLNRNRASSPVTSTPPSSGAIFA